MPTHKANPVRRQLPAVPMASFDGPSAAELRAHQVLNRFRVSREVAEVIAAAAYGSRPEHWERRV